MSRWRIIFEANHDAARYAGRTVSYRAKLKAAVAILTYPRRLHLTVLHDNIPAHVSVLILGPSMSHGTEQAVVTTDGSVYVPAALLSDLVATPRDTLGLVILNQPITKRVPANHHGFDCIWRKALYRVCADGGANELYNFFDRFETGRSEHVRGIPWMLRREIDLVSFLMSYTAISTRCQSQ